MNLQLDSYLDCYYKVLSTRLANFSHGNDVCVNLHLKENDTSCDGERLLHLNMFCFFLWGLD